MAATPIALPATSGTEYQWRIVYFQTSNRWPPGSSTQGLDWARYAFLDLKTTYAVDVPPKTSFAAYKGIEPPPCIVLHAAKYMKRFYRRHKDWELVCKLDEPSQYYFCYGPYQGPCGHGGCNEKGGRCRFEKQDWLRYGIGVVLRRPLKDTKETAVPDQLPPYLTYNEMIKY
ncbi:uncharacterized protein AB675_9207 [Cyphellophora attinorum]|uniref:Uncharacterized protein n=1 Tax=Cyphellophora attinorum TaxID=1664694 RepID=A0A0N1HBF9_9EURO|nr:uncharacterized protein AB675_9207 [Phialophora attinorum]KPI41382.1 hypothetical protein AB675_9207 [Phialophora attinorum]